MPKLTEKQVQAHLACGGDYCPMCTCKTPAHGPLEDPVGGIVFRVGHCSSCDTVWHDIFVLRNAVIREDDDA